MSIRLPPAQVSKKPCAITESDTDVIRHLDSIIGTDTLQTVDR